MSEPEKAELKSMDVAEDKRWQLAQMFPEVITETRTPDGKLMRAVDFEKLKAVLGTFSEVLEHQKERYGMTWPGKNECLKIIQQPSIATLKPCREESINFDQTENLFIEGDNLEVLKLLQKAYYGKVKMIYIDPPYNTGKEFIYPDKYAETLDTYLAYTGQVDAEGRKFSTNTEAEGRFHSKWLQMMYPRLYLARNLLREDGVIFISIDDGEVATLRAICDDIFGQECFAGCVTRVTGTPTGGGNRALVNEIDYVLVYFKTPDVAIEGVAFSEDDAEIYDKEDANGRYLTRPLRRTGGEDRREDRPSMYYAVRAPDGHEIFPIAPAGYESRWICGKAKYDELERNGLIEWVRVKKNGEEVWQVYQKFYLEGRLKQPSNLWSGLEGNKKATRDLKALFDGEKVFSFPKPVGLIRHILQLASDSEDSIVLDFFAGSGTTAHAVVAQNASDAGSRKFIIVQLPEPLDPESKEQRIAAAFCDRLGVPRNIAELAKERVRRAGKQVGSENPMFSGDLGFRVYKLASSNFKVWDSEQAAKAPENIAKQLELHEQHIDPNAGQEDILYELLLKAGFPLTTKVEKVQMAGKDVFSVADGALLICLEREITKELIKAMAEADPLQVICLDEGFKANDQLKANAVQTFKARSQGKDKEAGIVFRTV